MTDIRSLLLPLQDPPHKVFDLSTKTSTLVHRFGDIGERVLYTASGVSARCSIKSFQKGQKDSRAAI